MSTASTETNPKLIHVLDHGRVELVDFMGGDERVVAAARVSGGKARRSSGGLITYLVKNRHTSPLEHTVLEFRVKAPIFVARQWMRHRAGSFNEISGRYAELPAEYYLPERPRLVEQSATNKQASSTTPLDEKEQVAIHQSMAATSKHAFDRYEDYLAMGLARETARIILPLNTYTEFMWQVNLHNLLHFIDLRAHEHAQYEIRVYADALKELARLVAPITVAAFEEHVQYAHTMTKTEWDELQMYCARNSLSLEGLLAGDYN